MNTLTDNVCYCKCHVVGKSKCLRCKVLHLAREGVRTHSNDKENPDYTIE
jgi:hypothetical protein